mmetsp:Transcript_7910/g.17489  ORF Transcript_7910/g.17489 Transcript_7910/m.17489 type:complete len:708 (-) Transcript_7910:92-2215(-)
MWFDLTSCCCRSSPDAVKDRQCPELPDVIQQEDDRVVGLAELPVPHAASNESNAGNPRGGSVLKVSISEDNTNTVTEDTDGETAAENNSPSKILRGKSMTRMFGKAEAGVVGNKRQTRGDLDATDLKLSRGLSIQLGLASAKLPGAPTPEPPKAVPHSSNRGVHIEGVYEYCTVKSKIQIYEMGADVIHRRIKDDDPQEADEEEDMASVASTESMVSEESGGTAQRTNTNSSGRGSAVGDGTGSSGPSSAGAGSGGGGGAKKKTRPVPAVQRKQSTLSDLESLHSGPRYLAGKPDQNQEAISRWGLIVGAILHTKALDFGLAAQRAMQRKLKRIGKEVSDTGNSRGRLFNHVRSSARQVTKQARRIARKICREEDMLDSEWSQEGLLQDLFGNDFIDNISLLATAARKIFAVQPPIAEAQAPCRVFGDLHGHFRDLLLLFVSYGGPDEHNAPMFVFNGDFVDRGDHQIEVIGLLLALKVLLPERIWLVRGNHEERGMNKRYGFFEECRSRLGRDAGTNLFETIERVFDHLPFACLIDQRVLVVHGGIGDGAWKVDDLRDVRRPLLDDALYDLDNYWLYNVLWSDPIEDDDKGAGDVFGVHKSPRGGMTTQFGWNITKTFCARNGLGLIVRSHQSKQDSLGFDVMHEDLLMRVFSARDYEGHGNDGAVLFIQPENQADPKSPLLVRPQVLAALRPTSSASKLQAPPQR